MTAAGSLQDRVNFAHISTGTGRAAILTANAMLSERMAYNAQGMVEYYGIAEIGTPEPEFAWAIKKMEYDGTNVVAIKWGSGTAAFSHSWINHDLITYS